MKDFQLFEKPKDPLCLAPSASASRRRTRSASGPRRSQKPETINYRTFKPERDGLFCAKILAQ